MSESAKQPRSTGTGHHSNLTCYQLTAVTNPIANPNPRTATNRMATEDLDEHREITNQTKNIIQE